jgi:hypothetical protein
MNIPMAHRRPSPPLCAILRYMRSAVCAGIKSVDMSNYSPVYDNMLRICFQYVPLMY